MWSFGPRTGGAWRRTAGRLAGRGKTQRLTAQYQPIAKRKKKHRHPTPRYCRVLTLIWTGYRRVGEEGVWLRLLCCSAGLWMLD